MQSQPTLEINKQPTNTFAAANKTVFAAASCLEPQPLKKI